MNSDIARTTFRSEGNYGCIPGQGLGPQHSEDLPACWLNGVGNRMQAGCGRPKSAHSETNIVAVIF